MKTAKLEELIMSALMMTFRRQPTHGERLLNRPRTVGSRLTGPLMTADSFIFRKVFCREGLQELDMPDPIPGCRYFEVPLYTGEGVVGALRLRDALNRDLEIYAEPYKLHGQESWRFIANYLGQLPPATCLRFILGPASLKPEEDPQELIVWHWFPHNPGLMERPDINGGEPIESYNRLVECTRAHFEDAIVKLAATHAGMQKIWPSVFKAQMSHDPSDDETTALPVLPEQDPEGFDPSDTTTVLVFSPDDETGRVTKLMNIVDTDAKDPPETIVSEEERSLRLE